MFISHEKCWTVFFILMMMYTEYKTEVTDVRTENSNTGFAGFQNGTANGLTSEEAGKRLTEYGPNAFVEKKAKTKLQMFLSQLRDSMIYILFGATVISLFLGNMPTQSSSSLIILLNAVIGMVQEAKAEKSLEALKTLQSDSACSP